MTIPAKGAAGRINVLDGLRGVAVLAVIGFHYFSRFTPPENAENLYPYGSLLALVPVFQFGYLGVHLFFLVSGFVISLTLTQCDSWRDFLVRRFARLAPAMLLCSSITFLIVGILAPRFWSLSTCSFVPSLTFVDPLIYKRLFGLDCGFMDSAYWSLFVEVRFYALAALLYFAGSRPRFLRNCAIVLSIAIAVLLLERFRSGTPGLGIADLVLFPEFAPWLFGGVAFYFIWHEPGNRLAWVIVGEALLAAIARSRIDAGGTEWIAVVAIFALFGTFALKLGVTKVFGARWLSRIGSASYSLYLLHQRIGVTAIAVLAGAVGVSGPASIGVALAVAVALAFAAIAIYDWYEIPARRLITRVGGKLLSVPPRARPGSASAPADS